MEIAHSGNTDLLVISGKANDQEIQDCWEKIVKKNSQVNGLGVDAYFDNIKIYAKLLADYELVKLSLMQLMFVVDDSTINFLNALGYKIDTSGAKAYSDSIQNAFQKCKNLTTKLKTRFNQIQAANQDSEKTPEISIEEALANISVSLGLVITIDVTLARYNEYRKIIRKKHEAAKMKKAA